MIKKLYPFLSLSLLLACTNIENAKPTKRTSFIRYYGTGINHAGVMALPDTDGGFILVGNVVEGDTTDITVIKTDEIGNTLWETIVEDGSVNSVTIADNGYFIAGDRITFDGRAGIALSEVVNSQAHIFKVDKNGSYAQGVDEVILRDTTDSDLTDPTIDFKGHAALIDNDSLYVLGSYKLPQASLILETFEQCFIAAYKLSELSGDRAPAWIQIYNAQQKDFKNTNTLHLSSSGAFIWANTFVREEDDLSVQDANIYIAPKKSVPTDKDVLSESARVFKANDFQRSTIGYGLVGTYSQRDGTGSNIFFARYNGSTTGSIDEATIRYFDGQLLALTSENKDNSESQDEGKAIAGTRDGGFMLACTFNSTLTRGNGGKDILLLKLDPIGNLLWSRLIGGSGDEEVASIRQLGDGSFIICGTIRVNGLSSLMLIKTDVNGKLTN